MVSLQTILESLDKAMSSNDTDMVVALSELITTLVGPEWGYSPATHTLEVFKVSSTINNQTHKTEPPLWQRVLWMAEDEPDNAVVAAALGVTTEFVTQTLESYGVG